MTEMRSLKTIEIFNPKKGKNFPETVIINLVDFDPKKHKRTEVQKVMSAQAEAEIVLKKAQAMMKDAQAMMDEMKVVAENSGTKDSKTKK